MITLTLPPDFELPPSLVARIITLEREPCSRERLAHWIRQGRLPHTLVGEGSRPRSMIEAHTLDALRRLPSLPPPPGWDGE
jgi:hypothetical protein